MKREDGFLLQKVADSYYFLPYGQNIVNHRRGIKTNETGAFLWEVLREECTYEELISRYLAYCNADISDTEEARQDIEPFLEQLRMQHMLIDKSQSSSYDSRICRYLSIGGLVLKITIPAAAYATEFNTFKTTEDQAPDQTIDVCYDTPDGQPEGTILIRNNEIILCDTGKDYLILFPAYQSLTEARLSKDGTHVSFFCKYSSNDNLAQDLFHAIRFVYLYLAQKRGLFALHSASLLYRGHAWLFSGRSGEGKSTHTRLWNTLFGTPYINGDLNLISINDGTPYIYGIPWCGTSNISDTANYPLGGIILLKQALNDACVSLSEDEKQIFILQRLISPAWTNGQLQSNLEFVEKLVKNIEVCRLFCTKNDSAAYTIKERIDDIYSKK